MSLFLLQTRSHCEALGGLEFAKYTKYTRLALVSPVSASKVLELKVSTTTAQQDLFSILMVEPRTLGLTSKCSTIELQPQSLKKSNYLCFYTNGCLVFIRVCAPCVCQVAMEGRKGHWNWKYTWL